MKGSLTLVGTVVLASCLTVALAQQVDNSKDKKTEDTFTCDGQDVTTWEKASLEKYLDTCLDKYAPTKDLPANSNDEDKKNARIVRLKSVENNTCLVVCVFQAVKMFDDKGAFNKVGTDAWVDKHFPGMELAAKIKSEIGKCVNEKGQGLSMEENCISHKDLFACAGQKLKEVCKM